MRRPWAVQIFLGMLWRLAKPTRLLVLRAPRNDFGPACPESCALVRIASTACAAVAPRLAHGDEFFGWLLDGRVVSFGWVTYQDRKLGPIQLAGAMGRAFLYNFHTLDWDHLE